MSIHLRLTWIVMLALATGAGSCSNSKTVVLVNVEGTARGIYELHVKVTAGALSTSIFVKDPTGGEIDLPTDFTLEMDRSRQGALQMIIDGRDEAKDVLASGAASLPALEVGEENHLTVILGAPVTPPPDGGGETDGGADAGEDAGDDAPAAPVDAQADGGVAVDAGSDEGAVADPDAGDDAGTTVDAEGLLDADPEVI